MVSRAAFIAANRFGLGASAEGMRALNADPKGWVQAMIDRPADPYDDGNPDVGALVTRLRDFQKIKKEMKDDPVPDKAPAIAFRKETQALVLNAIGARFARNVSAPNPVQERLALFWGNHFTVSARNKGSLAAIVPTLERDAIRPHMMGRFEDMVLAVAQHPAMLLYLDNAQSVGPDSKAGERRGVGLNENLGREIMELHTLGVGGGYTQADVTTLAKILTGWSIDPPAHGGSGNFRFNARSHEPGPETLLGKTYEQGGMAQGVAALRDIAGKPATARFIATKLVRHFVRDDPDAGDVARVADVFSRTGGDLRAVMRAVAVLPFAWAHPLPKVKTPYEMIVAAFRGLDLPPEQYDTKRLLRALDTMDHRPLNAPSPAGWPDRAAEWVSSGAVMNRIEWCHALAQKIAATTDPAALAEGLIGPVAAPETLAAIDRAPSAVDGLALLLASPEFQRR